MILSYTTKTMTNWKTLIENEMGLQKETFDDVVECTLTEEELMVEFYDGYGGSEGKPFTLWTTHRVYFPVVYDGAEWVESVSRNPDGKPDVIQISAKVQQMFSIMRF